MTKYSYITGILAVGLMLAACSSYEEDVLSESQQKVKAQIALSVSGKAGTRMTTAATQADEAFQGMQDIRLLLFRKAGTNENPVESGDSHISSPIQLTDLPSDGLYNNKSKLYFDVFVPLGINSFLVYGRSLAETNGQVAPSPEDLDADPADITFSPVPFVSSVTTGKAAGEKGDNIVDYLNSIFKASDSYDWSDETNCPILYGLYPMVEEMKAGSSASVKAFVQEIYDVLKEPASETYVQDVLKAILAVETLPETLPAAVTLPENCTGYPADCGLPDGSAVVLWVDGQFKAVTDKNNLGAMNVDVTKFVKPAELWYRSNSRINTDILSHETDYETKSTWNDVLGVYAVQNGTVAETTKSIAIRQQLNYAVSRLDLKLTASGETLKDNADTPNDIPVSDLKITGVLVGQQSPVDYLFHSKWTKEGDPLYTIYDSQIDEDASAFNASEFTHTLVMETLKDQAVNVAIEIQNNSDIDIVTGSDKHIVPPGCKFYLIGQLVVKSGNDTDGYTYTTGYDANDPALNRVFCQDHYTEVTFTVADLKKGYYVIPPLSNAALEFSLEVIDWKLSSPTSTILK